MVNHQELWLTQVNDSESDQPATSSIMFFSSLSDAINHYIYLKVAHGSNNIKSDQASGKHVTLSGIFHNSIESLPFVNGYRADIQHIMLPFEDEQPHKVLIHEFLKKIQIWSARTDVFQHSGNASGFMNTHALYHASVSINPFWISTSLLSNVQDTQVRLPERVLGLVRRFPPHLEQLIFVSGQLRSDLKELEFSLTSLWKKSASILGVQASLRWTRKSQSTSLVHQVQGQLS